MQEAGSNLKLTLAAAAVLAALACGERGEAQTLVIAPEAPTVVVGETLPITVTPMADLAGDVDWEVQETYGGGLLQSHGLHVIYVPPEAAGTYHLLLRAPGRNGQVYKDVVAVKVLPGATVDPVAPRLQPGSSIQFRVRMKGLARDTATWAVEEAEGGEIGPEGRYTAPRKPGLYHITATSTMDPSAVARTTVTVGAD